MEQGKVAYALLLPRSLPRNWECARRPWKAFRVCHYKDEMKLIIHVAWTKAANLPVYRRSIMIRSRAFNSAALLSAERNDIRMWHVKYRCIHCTMLLLPWYLRSFSKTVVSFPSVLILLQSVHIFNLREDRQKISYWQHKPRQHLRL